MDDKLENISNEFSEKKVILEKGKKYSFCTCGFSANIPFCDNSHKKINEEKGTSYCSFKIIPEKDIVLYVSSKNWRKNESR